MIKPATSKDLAELLGVSVQAVNQYPKTKRTLMKYGLAYMLSEEKLKVVVKDLKVRK